MSYLFQRWREVGVGLLFLVLVFLLHIGSYRFSYATPTGDEPHYIVMTDSLVRDHDLNVQNNYLEIKYEWARLDKLGSMHLVKLQDAKEYPLHRWGLPILLAPAYALAGYDGVVIFLTLLSLLAIWILLEYAIDIGVLRPERRLFAFSLAIFLTPVFLFAGHVYPEVVIFVAVSILFWQKLMNAKPAAKVLVGAILLYFVALQHEKLTILFLPLMYVMLYRHRLNLFVLSSVIAFLGYLGTIFQIYGYDFFDFMRNSGGSMIDVVNIPRSFLTLTVDQRFGILYTFPLLLLFVPLWSKGSLWLWISVVPYLLLILMFREAHGGTTPPGRYLYPLYPLVIVGIFSILDHVDRIKMFGVIFVWAVVVLIGYVIVPSIVYPVPAVPNGYLYYFLGLENSSWLAQRLPSFSSGAALLSHENRLAMINSVLPVIAFCWLRIKLKK